MDQELNNNKEKLWGSLRKLRELENDGTIDHETARLLMKQTKERIIEQFLPKQASNGSWYINIRFAPGAGGRKTIRKGSREALEEAICEFVGSHLKKEEFGKRVYKDYRYKAAFDRWIKAQQYKNKNTEARNWREYRRFFEKLDEGKEMAEMNICQIKSVQIETLMSAAVQAYNLTTRKALEDYNMFFVSVYKQAIADSIIKPDENPCIFVIENRFFQYGRSESDEDSENRVINADTMKILDTAAKIDQEKKINYMPPYAYELASLTGMRVGELAGLMWKNVDFENGFINIVQSLKYDEATKTYYISTTKNKKKRKFPITDDIRKVLQKIQDVQKIYGKTGDYVFSNGKDFSTNRQISAYLQNKRQQYKIPQPVSIHAERRTINSIMAAQGVSSSIRSSLFGHIPRVNENNYTYDLMAFDDKRDIVDRAGKR